MHNPPGFLPHTNDVHLSAGESYVVGFGFCFQCSQAEVSQLTLSECCGKAQGACPHSLCHGMCFLAKGHPNFCHGLKICENICKSATNRLKLFLPHFGHVSWEEAALTAHTGQGSLWLLPDWCLLLQEGFCFSTPSPHAAKILIFGAVSQARSSHSAALPCSVQGTLPLPPAPTARPSQGTGSGWALRHFSIKTFTELWELPLKLQQG